MAGVIPGQKMDASALDVIDETPCFPGHFSSQTQKSMDLKVVTGDELYSETCRGIPERQRWVHLDLKGAPPKISYLLELLPTLKRWGATGLLVEYEDTFPYEDDLLALRKPTESYSKDNISELQNAALSLDLEYVPLIQTFGHLEFVLKHEDFKQVREDKDNPMTLCPSYPESLPLVKKILVQVIESHRGLKYFHIGADEVFPLGKCPRCQERIIQSGENGPADIFLDHVTRVLSFLKDKYPQLQLIMWDDMLRKVTAAKMKEFRLGDLVEPMVWIYYSDAGIFEQTVGKPRWEILSQVFTHYWAASAFKGAFGGGLFHVPIGRHIQNHLLWMKEIHENVPQIMKCRGVTLTGWQRYKHFSVLCELLPAGLPSLCGCLQVLTKGSFSIETHTETSKELGFPSNMPLFFKPTRNIDDINKEDLIHLSFPGSPVYQIVWTLSELVYVKDEGEKNRDVRLQKLNELAAVARRVMGEVYHQPTIDEWITQRLLPMVQYI